MLDGQDGWRDYSWRRDCDLKLPTTTGTTVYRRSRFAGSHEYIMWRNSTARWGGEIFTWVDSGAKSEREPVNLTWLRWLKKLFLRQHFRNDDSDSMFKSSYSQTLSVHLVRDTLRTVVLIEIRQVRREILGSNDGNKGRVGRHQGQKNQKN